MKLERGAVAGGLCLVDIRIALLVLCLGCGEAVAAEPPREEDAGVKWARHMPEVLKHVEPVCLSRNPLRLPGKGRNSDAPSKKESKAWKAPLEALLRERVRGVVRGASGDYLLCGSQVFAVGQLLPLEGGAVSSVKVRFKGLSERRLLLVVGEWRQETLCWDEWDCDLADLLSGKGGAQ